MRKKQAGKGSVLPWATDYWETVGSDIHVDDLLTRTTLFMSNDAGETFPKKNVPCKHCLEMF